MRNRLTVIVVLFLVLALPLQSFSDGRCCQAAGGECCSATGDDTPTNCCAQRDIAPACAHCASKKGATSPKVLEKNCGCRCKSVPSDSSAPLVNETKTDAPSVSLCLAESCLFVRPRDVSHETEVIRKFPGRRLQSVYCVWRN